MSHYHFIKCCCFQLCNVFRTQNMEVDQCLLESLPLGQRQRLVRRMRCDQIRAYYERERALQKQCQLHGNAAAATAAAMAANGGGASAAAAGSNGGAAVANGGAGGGVAGVAAVNAKVRGGHRKKQRVSFPPGNMVQDAVVRNDDKEVLRLLKEGVDINTPLASGGSLLHLCARHDNVFAAEVLMERGLNVNLQDEDLWTALHVACACDHPDMVLLLLLAGANVLLQDLNGNIPLDYATEGTESSYILLAHLEENGVDLSSLHLLRTQRASTMLSDVRNLISTGVSLNQHNEDGVTLLHMACASGYREVVSLLLESGADPQVADNNYWTPLHLASKYGQTRIVGQLLKYKADPTVLNCSQDKPSDVAASDKIADMLLRAEEVWIQRRKDPGVALPMPDENCEDLAQDVTTPVKKLTPLKVPISKQDSLLEKDRMFRDLAGALSRQPSQDNGLDGPYPTGTSKLEQVKLMPPAPNDDLASLSELTDSSLLYEMQKRFGNDQIYTYIGHILLLVNPNKDLPIYSTLVSQLYLSSTGRLCSSLPPHIFSSAERAYHMMLQERRPQCFVISGESGSGKTEACKHILKHLAARSSPKGFALEPRMKHVNCVLEAFGHAKTQMNPNSSRFIKLLTVQYCDKKRTILRARVQAYMLEKARLTCTPKQQLNFNVFTLMAEGLSAEEKSNVYLNNLLTHRYMGGTDTGETAPVGTANAQSRERLAALKQALRALGLNRLEVENVFVVLSALLHLGDVRFSALGEADTALPADLPLLERVSCLLQVSPDDLGAALTTDVQYFKGDMITRRHTVEVANHVRELLAKALYSRLFSHLVNNINFYLQGPENAIGDPALEIGILDIFGFEQFQKNSFEQLCVNMVSERVQQYVTEVLFQQEQQECLQEAIATETMPSPGNQQAVLDFFFQKPQGVLSVVDDESSSVRWSEHSLYKRLQAQLDSSGPNTAEAISLTTKDGNGNPPPKDQGPSFTVSHYAAKMTYDLTGSLERNRDALPQNVLFVMKSSESVLVQQLFQCKLTLTGSLVPPVHHRLQLRGPKACLLLPKGPSGSSSSSSSSSSSTATATTPARDTKKHLELSKLVKKKAGTGLLLRLDRGGPITIATQLRNSLSEITAKLQSCTPHFVQCVRPNASGQPDAFHSYHVSAQLQYVGVLEMVRMIRYGYPVRLSFNAFLSRYRELADTTLGERRKVPLEERCRHVLQHCKLQGWQMGSSKVFLRYWQADHLNDRCHQLHKKIVTCQKVIRGWLVRKRARGRVSSVGQRGRSTSTSTSTSTVQRFLQGAEEQGMRAYDSLVLQNASDIARENDRLRGAPGTNSMTPSNTTASSSSVSASTAGAAVGASIPAAPGSPASMALGERPEPVGKEEDSPKRPVEKCGRVHRHYRSSSVPLPLQMDNMVHPAGGCSIKPALQPVGHSTEDGGGSGPASLPIGGGGMSSPRKQPPPKPKRDPNTRLSASYEAVSAGLSIAPCSIDGCQASPAGSPPKTQLSPSDLSTDLSKPRPHSDDYSTMSKKIPPPKPKRSPNTKLTGSYEEISAAPNSNLTTTTTTTIIFSSNPTSITTSSGTTQQQRPTDMKLACLTRTGLPHPAHLHLQQHHHLHHHQHCLASLQRACSVDGPHVGVTGGGTGGGGGGGVGGSSTATLSLPRGQDEEDVYIEMVGTQSQRALSLPEMESPETGEAVYEEMKYFLPEDGGGSTGGGGGGGGSVVTGTAGQGGPAVVAGVKVGTPPVQSFMVRPETLEPLIQTMEVRRVPGPGMAGVGGEQHPALPPKQGAAKDGSSSSSSCEIPAPFPNLLPHRPPLLVFPPSPVTCSPASDESPLTPLEVKKLPVFETNLNYNQEGGSPLSPQYARQRADSSPSLTVLHPDRSTPPLTPPAAPAPPMGTALPPPSAPPPPPYRPPSHFPFPPEPGFLALSRGHSGSMDVCTSTPPLSAGVGSTGGGGGGGGKPPFSPVKGMPSSTRPEPRRAHSCSSSPLLFNPANGRPLTSPLDELNTLFTSGRNLLRKSTTGRKMRDGGFSNSNINLPGRDEQGCNSLSPQMQDKNANTHNHSPNSPGSAPVENGNQLSNGSLEDESHPKSNGSSATLQHRHLDSHHTQLLQRLRASCGEDSSALQDLLLWRRALCESRPDWQHLLQPHTSPTILLKNKAHMTKKASP